jgi:hypothetical protein
VRLKIESGIEKVMFIYWYAVSTIATMDYKAGKLEYLHGRWISILISIRMCFREHEIIIYKH